MSNPTLQYAGWYRAKGWSVIPIRKKAKIPSVDTWQEFQKRLPTVSELQAWFNSHESGVGVVTGRVSNLVVLDVDGQDGYDSLRKYNLKSPYIVKSDHGQHLYYSYPKGVDVKNSVKRIPGLDVRGEGGYVVAPPSIHPSGAAYSWSHPLHINNVPLPAFPFELFKPSVKEETNTEGWIARTLKDAREQRRPNLLKIIGKLRFDNWTYEDVIAFLQPHADQLELPMQELHRLTKYSFTRPSAKDKAPTEAKDESFSLWSYSNAYEEYQTIPKEDTDPEFATGFKWVDKQTFGLSRGYITTIAARTDVGKTTFAIQTALELCKVGAKVLFLSTEAKRQDIRDRYSAIATGVSAFKISNRQTTDEEKSLVNEFAKAAKYHEFIIYDGSTPSIEITKQAIEHCKPDVIIFDYFQEIEENETKYMEKFVRNMRTLIREHDVPLLMCAQLHDGRPDFKTGKVPPPCMSDLKKCKYLLDASKTVILLDWDRDNDQNFAGLTPVDFNIAKNKGPRGKHTFLLNRAVPRFEEV